MIRFIEERTFRRTEGVHFADISVPGSNGIDLVEHTGAAISPPEADNVAREYRRWYRHSHQVDYNRCIRGQRLFELYNPAWVDQHWYVFLDTSTGALEIPVGCYHRSHSGLDGSLLINHAVRDELYDENREFIPQVVRLPDDVVPNYWGITPGAVEFFINHGRLPSSS